MNFRLTNENEAEQVWLKEKSERIQKLMWTKG
jgi:hypothetical protein